MAEQRAAASLRKWHQGPAPLRCRADGGARLLAVPAVLSSCTWRCLLLSPLAAELNVVKGLSLLRAIMARSRRRQAMQILSS